MSSWHEFLCTSILDIPDTSSPYPSSPPAGRLCPPQTSLLPTSRRGPRLFLCRRPHILRERQVKVDPGGPQALPWSPSHPGWHSNRQKIRRGCGQGVKVAGEETSDKGRREQAGVPVQGYVLPGVLGADAAERQEYL